MDVHPDKSSDLPAHNFVNTRNLSIDSATSQNRDPQFILNSLYPTHIQRHGLPIDNSEMADWEAESGSSSVVYLGHNVFERHKTFDFPQHSTRNRPHQLAKSHSTPTTLPTHTDPPNPQAIGSEIVRWATAIPDNLPLDLSALAVMLRGSSNKVPPSTEYAIMAFLAIFERPERRLTDEGIFDSLKEGFPWFKTHSENDFWKRDVINCMLFDSRFKAEYEGDRSWTINISELHKRPFVHRDARDRPMRLLPPSSRTVTTDDHNFPSYSSVDDVNMSRSYSAVSPVSGAMGGTTHPGFRRQNHVTTSRGILSEVTHSPSSDSSHHMIPPIYYSPPSRSASHSSRVLPSYSETYDAAESSWARENHVHPATVASDNLVLPSIRDVLGTEMHMVEERRRTTGN